MKFSLILICIFLFWLCNNLDAQKGRKVFVVTITIILVLVSGLRHESVGNDTVVYMTGYENPEQIQVSHDLESFWDAFTSQSDSSDKDPGYYLFVTLLSQIIPSGRAYLFVIAAISMGLLAYFAHKNVSALKGILFFYVYYISIFYSYIPNSAIRQSFALSFILIGYGFFQKRQVLKFAGMVLLGSFFHMSALIALIMIPFFKINKVKVVGFSGFILFGLALLNVKRFASLFLSGNDLYNAYLLSNYYGASGKPIVVIFLFLGLFLISYMGLINDKNIMENKMFYYGAFFALIFSSLIWVNPSLIRLTAYFGPLLGVSVANSYNKIKFGNGILIVVILIFLFSALRDLNDYYFMWDNVAV